MNTPAVPTSSARVDHAAFLPRIPRIFTDFPVFSWSFVTLAAARSAGEFVAEKKVQHLVDHYTFYECSS